MNDLPQNDTVVCLAAMRKELLLRKRLSPTVSERERARLALEDAGPDDEVAVPLFQAFVTFCYLADLSTKDDAAHRAYLELLTAVNGALARHKNGWGLDLMVAISAPTYAALSSIPMTDVMLRMKARFTDAIRREGYEPI